ncbi:hypothetical protein GCM10011408_37740 [Dyella caseinilytica]|nr:hypothetical protein GCM10011408_37740 [Dyella caseinilytica]
MLWALLNLPLLLGIRVLPWDALDQFYPTVYFNVHSLRLGLAPWWNPHIYSGYPQIADPQGMLFSPLLMAWMLLRQAPGMTWFTWGVLLHLLMGGAAMLAILRRDGANALGALVGATVFMAGGVAASRLEHVPIVIAYAYAPLALLALRQFLTSPGVARGAWLGLSAGAMVTQLVQVSYLLVLVISAYGLIGSLWHWPNYNTKYRWRWLAGILVALACSLALGLPQLLLTSAYTSLSNRSELPLASVAGASLDSRAFLSLIVPNALHALRGKYDGPASLIEAYLYIGIIPLLLLTNIGSALRNPQQRRQVLFFGVVAVVACLYMFGTNAWLYPWLYAWLPGIQHFRRPADAAYVFNLSLSIWAGLSAGHFQLASRRRVSLLLGAAAVLLALASSYMRADGIRWQAGSLAAACMAILVLVLLQKTTSPWHKTLWLLALMVVDYRCFSLNGTFNESRDTIRQFAETPAVSFLSTQLQSQDQIPPPRIETLNTGVPWDNQVSLHGIDSTQGYNPLRYALYESWYGGRESSLNPRTNTAFNPSPGSALSQLLGVKYLVIGDRADAPPVSPPPGFTKIFSDQHETIWQADHVYPSLLTPTRVNLLAAGQLPQPQDFSATDFRTVLWLTPRDRSDEVEDRRLGTTCTGQVAASALGATPTTLSLHTRALTAGWLVINELDFPGWEATVDGQPVAIHRANGMFRAVCVPDGDHELQFRFHPWGMVAAVWNQQRAR